MIRIVNLVGRVLLTATLMLITASPGLAEIGRAQDALLHDQQVASAGPDSSLRARHPGDPPSRAPAKVPHCAFNHCPHSAAMAPHYGPATEPSVVGPLYVPFVPPLHCAAPRDGPDHPPRA